MKSLHFRLSDRRKRAVLDTVRTILEHKGYEVTTVPPGATVYDAIAEMARIGVGALPVVEAQELVGIVSERDYARKVILEGRSSKTTLVSEIMTRSPITVSPAQTVDECMRIVIARHIRHLPVVERGELKGIVSIGDLVKAIMSTQAFTIDQLHSYLGTGYPS